jgi:hypothetical protein
MLLVFSSVIGEVLFGATRITTLGASRCAGLIAA